MNRRQFLHASAAGILATPALARLAGAQESPFRIKYYPVAPGMGSRDTAPAPDGTIWFCGQRNGALGRLDPRDGSFKQVDLGKGAAPHGVIIGPDGAPWVTEDGQNAIARVDPGDHKVTLFRLPEKEAMPTSTLRCSIRTAFSGSPASPASMAGSIRNRAT